MINLIDEIEEIYSYDDLDEDEKLHRIIKLCNKENINYNNMISTNILLRKKISKMRYKLGQYE